MWQNSEGPYFRVIRISTRVFQEYFPRTRNFQCKFSTNSWCKSISTLGQKGRLPKCALKGSKHALIFFRVALPHRYLHIGSSTMNILEKLSRILPDSQKWHDSLDRKWMRPRNVGAARATLTREDSEWSRKFEEPWQSRPRDWRGVGQFFLQGRVKGLAKSL